MPATQHVILLGQACPSDILCTEPRRCMAWQSVGGGRGQDFGALQQHIDELTTAKFELQRGLAQQGKLAASLAAEKHAPQRGLQPAGVNTLSLALTLTLTLT